MSADNYYVIRRHPAGGFAAVQGFASEDSEPRARMDHQQFKTIDEAEDMAHNEYTEYGVRIHPECMNTPRTPRSYHVAQWRCTLQRDSDGSIGIAFNKRSGKVVRLKIDETSAEWLKQSLIDEKY
jgi:hypothetical protein